MYISKLKICNFRSFVGLNQVSLEPFSAVMVFSELGKNDFCMAIQFLFGRNLDDLGVASVENLYHARFSDSSNRVLEVGAVFETRRGETLQISRLIKDGRMIYLANESEVNPEIYQEIILGMGCNNSLRFSYDDFVKALWDNEGIETVVSNFMRFDFSYQDLQRELDRFKVTEIALKMQNEKHCLVMMRQNAAVDKVVDEYQSLRDQESRRQSTIEILHELSDEVHGYESSTPSSMGYHSPAKSQTWDDWDVDDEHNLTIALSDLMLKEAEVSGTILYNETKVAAFEEDASLFQGKRLERYALENRMSELKEKHEELESEILVMVEENSLELADLEKVRASGPECVKRLTAYGRLIDWLNCGQFTWIFRAVFGEDFLYGNLIDDRKDAENFLTCLKNRCVSSRQTFIILSEYSPKLKETLFEAGEKQSPLKNYTEVLTLLSKLKECGLVSNIPAVVNRGELPLESWDRDDEVIFVSNGEFRSMDGIFGRYFMTTSKVASVAETLKTVNKYLQRQDMLFQRYREQLAQSIKLRLELEALDKGVRVPRFKRIPPKPTATTRVIIPEIYQEYAQIFADYEKSATHEEISFEDFDSNQQPDLNKTKNDLKNLKDELSKIEQLKQEKVEELRSAKDCLNCKSYIALQETFVIGNPYIQPQPEKDKSALTLASRLKEIEMIINRDEVNELREGAQWRNMVLENLSMELNKTRRDANQSRKIVEGFFNIRLRELTPFLQFCNDSMASMLQEILRLPVDCELRGIDEENLVPMKMFIRFQNKEWTDIMDCCVFLRCVAVLIIFLHAASFRDGAVVLIDDLSDFFPKTDEDAKCILGQEDVMCFDLMVRIGDAIHSFLAKIRGVPNESPSEEDLMNLDQLLLFTSNDLAASTDVQVIIAQDVLDDSAQEPCVISAMMNI